MQTIQPVLKRGRNVWDQINMPKDEFERRVNKLKQKMGEEAIDILLVYGNGVNEYGNPCYISNFLIKMSQGALVLVPQNDDIALLYEGAPRSLPSEKKITWVEEIRACQDVSKECVKYMKEKSLIPATIGFIGLRQLMPYNQLQYIYENINQCTIIDSTHIMRDMRMVKSQRECDQIRRSSRIIIQAFKLISNILSQNINENILEAIIDREARLEGAEDFRMLVAKPAEGFWRLRSADDKQILPGDKIIIYLAVEFERYWSEAIRTFIVSPSQSTEDRFLNAQALYERILDMLKPKKTFQQFYKDAQNELGENKIYHMPEYSLGNGIGLSLQEPPFIGKEDLVYLEHNMCLTLRLAIEDPKMGDTMIGNTILISEDHPVVLT